MSPKHHKLKPSAEAVLAGILGKGCNIGIHKLSQISQGINQSMLKNTVNWCFNLKNIQAANTVILKAMEGLSLSHEFQRVPGQRHTSSDGRKVQVAVDSIHANYSFKYFGKDKGVTMYTYIEAIFATSHLIDTAFAPRLKKVGRQTLSSFSSKGKHLRRGDTLLPGHTVNKKLILSQWDNILRFMATIKRQPRRARNLDRLQSAHSEHHCVVEYPISIATTLEYT